MKKSGLAKAPKRSGEIRLLPAVIGVGAILFALKAGGLAFSANAATAPAAPAATPAAAKADAKPAAKPAVPAKPGTPDPVAAINAALPMPANKPTLAAAANPSPPADNLSPELEGAGISSAEIDVLSSLSDRRDALEQRQHDLDLRANVIAATEKRVDDKIAQLKALQAKIEALLGQRDSAEAQQLDGLVKVYTAMKPKDAARVFTSLDDQVRLGVAGRMKAETMAAILASLPPDIAQKLTVELAGRYKLSADTAAAPSAPPAPNAAPAAAPPQPAAPAKPGG